MLSSLASGLASFSPSPCRVVWASPKMCGPGEPLHRPALWESGSRGEDLFWLSSPRGQPCLWAILHVTGLGGFSKSLKDPPQHAREPQITDEFLKTHFIIYKSLQYMDSGTYVFQGSILVYFLEALQDKVYS